MPRNLLIIMTSGHAADAMGIAQADETIQTPNLDALAQRGVRFAAASTPSPSPVPARAAFFTGQPVHAHGHWDAAMPYAGQPPGWSHALRDAGVRTKAIGSMLFRSSEDDTGFVQQHGTRHAPDREEMLWASIRREDERLAAGKPLRTPPVTADAEKDLRDVAQEARAWLSATDVMEAEAPWCLFLGLDIPNADADLPRRFLDLYSEDALPSAGRHDSPGRPGHPWPEKQAANVLPSTDDSQKARHGYRRAYLARCSWLDHQVGEILSALEETSLSRGTTIVYTSDRGADPTRPDAEIISNMYQPTVAVPLILSPCGDAPGICRTPVSLLDLSATILAHFGLDHGQTAGRPLTEIAVEPEDPKRIIFSEYHATGSVSGGFMVRGGPWKLIHYHGFTPELFNLDLDPGETLNRATDPNCAGELATLFKALQDICDPAEVDARAFTDQAALILRSGGRDAVLAAARRKFNFEQDA